MKIIIIAVALLLAGCGLSAEGDLARAAINVKGALAADTVLENAEFMLCRGSTVGSVVRRYGVSTAKADAWRTVCRSDPEAVIIGP